MPSRGMEPRVDREMDASVAEGGEGGVEAFVRRGVAGKGDGVLVRAHDGELAVGDLARRDYDAAEPLGVVAHGLELLEGLAGATGGV